MAFSATPSLSTVLHQRATFAFEGAEIVSFDPRSKDVLVVGNGITRRVRIVGKSMAEVWSIAGSEWLPDLGDDSQVTHVVADPLGRGFFAALVSPRESWGHTGRLVIGDMETGKLLSSHEVGHGPDAAAFSPDGSTIIVANEGEPGVTWSGAIVDPPGSVSFFDVTGQSVHTLFFTLSGTDEISWLRIHPRNRTSVSLDIEPEYITVLDDRAYISLQENNAIAVIDWRTPQIVAIRGLEPILTVIDADGTDHKALVQTPVLALPMPDQITSFADNGRHMIVTANEGDSRGKVESWPLGDTMLLKERTANDPLGFGQTCPGTLEVCAFSEPLNGDGGLSIPYVLGARSISVIEASTGQLVGHTGSSFELAMAAYPSLYNGTLKPTGDLAPDSRSAKRGPEPEGVVLGMLGDRRVAFVGLERPGAIATIDLSTPEHPEIIDLSPIALHGHFAPEGLLYLSAKDSPLGVPLLLVACEVSGELVIYEVRESRSGMTCDHLNAAR